MPKIPARRRAIERETRQGSAGQRPIDRFIANHNHDLGIEAVPGVIDGGGNHAAGNGNPAQCINIDCK